MLCMVSASVNCYATSQSNSTVNRLSVLVVFSSDLEAYQQAWKGFRSYFEEKKVPLVVSTYSLKEQESELVCSKIRERNPDVVVTLGTKASRLAKEEIRDTPIVFCMVFNPSELAGSNSTGVSMEIPLDTRLQGIRRILPHARNIGVIYSSETVEAYREVSRRSTQLGLTVIGRQIDSEKQLPDALEEMSRRIDCFLMLPDSKLYSPISVKHLLLQSLRDGFPVVGLSSHYTRAGALFSFDCDYDDLGRQAAEFVSRIRNGEGPAHIPPSTPRKTRLSLNELAAGRLGIRISSEVVSQASEVFGR